MPIVRDSQGASVRKSLIELFPVHPRSFFEDDEDAYAERMSIGSLVAIERTRFLFRPLVGRGYNNEIDATGELSSLEGLAAYLNRLDDKRPARVRKQRRRQQSFGISSNERRLRIPQDVKRRRSAIFGALDIPSDYFGNHRVVRGELDQFVFRMRELIILDVLIAMQNEQKLVRVGDVWSFSVCSMDDHRATIARRARKTKAARASAVKYDDRSHHGEVSRRRGIGKGIRHENGLQARRAA